MAHLNCVGETAEGLRAVVDEIAEAGIENVLALRGDPPRGQTDFVQPEGGLGSAAELAAMISDARPELAIGGACFPEVHPRPTSLRGRPRLPEDQGRRRRQLPDHPALLRQPRLLRLRAPRARGRASTCRSSPASIPIVSYEQVRRICALCDATIPRDAGRRARGPRRRRARRVRVRDRLRRRSSARSCSPRGAPGIHFYALNRWPATRAILVRAARRAAVGPRPGRSAPALGPPAGHLDSPRDAGVSPQGQADLLRDHGEGERPLVLIHGLLMNRHMFDRLAPGDGRARQPGDHHGPARPRRLGSPA